MNALDGKYTAVKQEILLRAAKSAVSTMEDSLKKDIEKLVDLKREIMGVIKAVPNVEYQTLLEKRYLCFITWEQIAVDMNYSMQHIHRMHSSALKEIVVPKQDES